MKLFLKLPVSRDRINLAICLVFSLMLMVWSCDQYLANDSYYYWRWSQHLDWSYYDGSPLIAYLIRLCTMVFTDSNLTLALINKVILCLSSLVVYATARQNLDKSSSVISAMVCLFFPLSVSSIARGTTYDVPMFFFWACTLYFATAFAKNPERNRYLYLTGAAIGLLMLSKYTGIILILGILYSAIKRPSLRAVFTNEHFYLSIGLALLLFSPVIWWNYKHDWVSFLYQLSTHSLADANKNIAYVRISNVIKYLTTLNFLVLITWHLRPKNMKSAPTGVQLQADANWICFWFNGLLCLTSQIHVSWFAPLAISLGLLCGYAYQTDQFKRSIDYYLVFLTLLGSLFVGYQIVTQGGDRRHIIAHYLMNIPYQPGTNQFLIGDGWSTATALYPIQGHPLPKTFSCSKGSSDNQYQYWNGSFMEQIRSTKHAKIWYFSTAHPLPCLKKHFQNCRFFSKVPYNPKHGQFLRTYVCDT